MPKTCLMASVIMAAFAGTAIAQGNLPLDPEGMGFGGTVHLFPNTFAPLPVAGVAQRVAGETHIPRAIRSSARAISPSGKYVGDSVTTAAEREHRPLIHVKVRVIEVERSDGLAVSSVLDYVSNVDWVRSRTSGRPLNTDLAATGNDVKYGFENLRGITNFAVPGLITAADSGAGLLANLTVDHINWVARLLATEFDGDIITAPQVTTLNGENVTFHAGQKIPFRLGNNIIQDSSNNIQQFFYKHVGVLVSVTPRIVNWGPDAGDGKGGVKKPTADALQLKPIEASDLLNPEAAAHFVDGWHDAETGEPLGLPLLTSPDRSVIGARPLTAAAIALIVTHLNNNMGRMVEVAHNDPRRKAIERVDRDFYSKHTGGVIQKPVAIAPTVCCDWDPTDCTIDLDIVVRLSDVGTDVIDVITDENQNVNIQTRTNFEDNVRAISNIVQVRSGNGVVMGGLISMRDEDISEKVPVLGDVPWLGVLFRSKQTRRRKFETLIFVEAQVLPPLDVMVDECGPSLAEEITSLDFCNARQHLQGDICDSDLHQGLWAAGLADGYLPRPTHGETEYWRFHHSSVRDVRNRRIASQLHDTFK